MKTIIASILLLLLVISCGQNYNSNTFDKDIYQEVTIDVTSPEGERFYQAFNVIKDKCISCHTGYHNSYANYTTDAEWTASGLIVAGDYEGSFLRNKLKNYGGNMPASGSELSDSEIAYLEDWIVNL